MQQLHASHHEYGGIFPATPTQQWPRLQLLGLAVGPQVFPQAPQLYQSSLRSRQTPAQT